MVGIKSGVENVFKSYVAHGTEFTSDPLLKSQTENSNIVTLAGAIFILILSLSNLLDNQIPSSIKLFIEASILIFNRILFNYTKKNKVYTSVIIFLISFIVCESMISGMAMGAGIISIGVLITSIMYLSKSKFGFVLSICLIIFELFIIFFNSRIEWIYTYPEYMKTYFVRFIGAHIGGFIISYFGLKKQKELYNEVKKEKELRSKLFVNIVHDLKTPLTIIRNSIDQCLYGNNDDVTKRMLRDNINRMEKDVLHILNLERLERGFHVKDRDVLTNVSNLTFNICDVFRSFAKSRGIKLNTKISRDLYIRIDQVSYTEIMNNLLENAIKYTQSEGSVTVQLYTKNDQVHLSVEDTGVGIADRELEKIFESYYQAEVSTDSYYGLGIGLSIIKEICDIWRATVNVASIKGEGSTFTVSFSTPSKSIRLYSKGEEAAPQSIIEYREERIKDFKEGLQTILIVEDNLDIRNLLIRSFNNDYNLIVTRNGQEALDKYSSNPGVIDLIISDLMMPVVDGKEFITRLISREGGLVAPIIVLTAKSGNEESLDYIKLGAIDFVSKPFSIRELHAKVESVLNVFKNKQDNIVDNMGANIISFIADKCNIDSLGRGAGLDFKKLRKYSITSKEQSIIEHINSGLSYKEIAYEEKITVNTVKTHIYRIYKKCNVNSYTNLVNLFYGR